MEGRYHPQALGEKAYNKFGGKTVGLLMKMTESILESRFFVLKGVGAAACASQLV